MEWTARSQLAPAGRVNWPHSHPTPACELPTYSHPSHHPTRPHHASLPPPSSLLSTPQAASTYRLDVLSPFFAKYAKDNGATLDIEAFKKRYTALHGTQLVSTLKFLLPVANLDSE